MDLVLGPLLRYVDRSHATVWVETGQPCEVEVLGHRDRTFEVGGHHYGLVVVDLTARDEVTPYTVRLDGEPVWPVPDDPRPEPVIRKPSADRTCLVFGSCRASAPDTEPWTLPRAEDSRGFGIDALEVYARRLAETDHETWPDLLLMLGDQVYADAASPETREFARSRRDTSVPPHEDVADLEEYTCLYREAWTDPEIRWLLSTVPSAMVFDDHDIIDDWNISASWVADARAQDWWHERIVGGLVSYWLYQHLGNLSPVELEAHELYQRVRACEGDARSILRDFAYAADRDPTTARWSYHRRIGDADLVVLDTRAARVLGEDERDMLDASEWAWLEQQLSDPAPNVLLATTLPVLLPSAVDDVETWNERICDGAWGPLGRRAGEAIRRAFDLEHWAAFRDSQARVLDLLRDVATDPDVRNVVLLAGDVHHGSIERATWPGVAQPLWQVVASPMRQEVEPAAARAFGFARSRWGRRIGGALRRLARGARPQVSWRTVDGPVLRNHVAVLEATRQGEVDVRFLSADDGEDLGTVITRRLDTTAFSSR